MAQQQAIACRAAGLACEFEVHDTDEQEVLRVAQDHGKRIHGKDISQEQLRTLLREETQTARVG